MIIMDNAYISKANTSIYDWPVSQARLHGTLVKQHAPYTRGSALVSCASARLGGKGGVPMVRQSDE